MKPPALFGSSATGSRNVARTRTRTVRGTMQRSVVAERAGDSPDEAAARERHRFRRRTAARVLVAERARRERRWRRPSGRHSGERRSGILLRDRIPRSRDIGLREPEESVAVTCCRLGGDLDESRAVAEADPAHQRPIDDTSLRRDARSTERWCRGEEHAQREESNETVLGSPHSPHAPLGGEEPRGAGSVDLGVGEQLPRRRPDGELRLTSGRVRRDEDPCALA